MKASCIIASIALCATTALGAPAATRTIPERQIANTAEDAIPGTQTVFPSIQVQWISNSPATVSPNTPVGHLLSNPNEEIHAAVTFNIGPEYVGKECKLVFRLSIDDTLVAPNTSTPATFDLYRLPGRVNDKSSWGNRNPRGLQLGHLTPTKGAWDVPVGPPAHWYCFAISEDQTLPIMNVIPNFPCQQGEYSLEMVATPGSNIIWDSRKRTGLSMEIY